MDRKIQNAYFVDCRLCNKREILNPNLALILLNTSLFLNCRNLVCMFRMEQNRQHFWIYKSLSFVFEREIIVPF